MTGLGGRVGETDAVGSFFKFSVGEGVRLGVGSFLGVSVAVQCGGKVGNIEVGDSVAKNNTISDASIVVLDLAQRINNTPPNQRVSMASKENAVTFKSNTDVECREFMMLNR